MELINKAGGTFFCGVAPRGGALVSSLAWRSGTGTLEDDAMFCCAHSWVRLDVVVVRGRLGGNVYPLDSTLDLGGDVDAGGVVIAIELFRDAGNSIFGDLRS